MIIVTFDVYGTDIVVEMTDEEFKSGVLNNHENLTRERYPYTWIQSKKATKAEKSKIKDVKINDDTDPEVIAAKEKKVSKKFDGVKAKIKDIKKIQSEKIVAAKKAIAESKD